MEEFKDFSFFRGKLRFKQPKKHRLSIIEILFVESSRGIKKNTRVLDIGAGFGALSILIAIKYGCKVYALERDPLMLDLLIQNIDINGLKSKIEVIQGDLREYKSIFKSSSFDCVVTNPPFYNQKHTNNPYHFEEDTKLEDFILSAHYVLKNRGYLNLLLPTVRLNEALRYLIKEDISPAYMKFFYTKESKNAKFARITCIKGSKSLVNVEKPLIINTLDGKYTQEVQNILDSMI